MKLQFLEGQHFECRDCSKCCRSKWQIHVDDASRERIRGSLLELRVIEQFGKPAVEQVPGDMGRVAKRADGGCVFLNEHDLCSIHAEIDRKAKPIGCRQFPFLIRPTPDGVVVGASFYCPSIQKNSGQELSAYAPEIEELVREHGYQPVGFHPIRAGQGLSLDWPAYRALEESLSTWLREQSSESALARGILTLGRTLLLHQKRTDPVLALESLRGALQRPPAYRLEEDEVLCSLREFFLAALIGTVEAPHPEMARPITEALLEGREVELTKFGWSGAVPGLYVFLSGPEQAAASALEHAIGRYLQAMLFRKYLAVDRPVLDNLAALSLVPGLLRFYHFVSGLRSPGAAPEEHIHNAYDVAEMELLTHASGVSPLFAAFGSAYLEQVSLLPE